MDRQRANKIAKELLDYIGAMDPQWADRIEITHTERQWDSIQVLGSYVANVLDAGTYLTIPRNGFFEPGVSPAGQPTKCAICEKTFTPEYAGAETCSNECAYKFYAPKLSQPSPAIER